MWVQLVSGNGPVAPVNLEEYRMKSANAIALAIVISVLIMSIAAVNILSPKPTDPLAQQLREAHNIAVQKELIKFHKGK